MATLYLITHAHTRQQPGVDAATWELSAQGQAQAEALSRQPFWERVERIVLSSEPKTRLTVVPVLATRSLPVTVEARFDELRRTPEWTDDYVARVAAVFAHPSQSMHGWEPAADALRRFLTGLDNLRRQVPGRTMAVVGHGLTLSLYRAHLLGRDQVNLDDWRALHFAAVAEVDWDRNELRKDFTPVAGGSRRA